MLQRESNEVMPWEALTGGSRGLLLQGAGSQRSRVGDTNQEDLAREVAMAGVRGDEKRGPGWVKRKCRGPQSGRSWETGGSERGQRRGRSLSEQTPQSPEMKPR